jgi:ketosteroid isomerase-like protein
MTTRTRDTANAMSENLELVRMAFQADLDAAVGWWHPRIEWAIAKEHPEARTLSGRDAVVAYLRDWEEVLNGAHLDIDRFVDAGAQVVAVGTVHGTGAVSGAAVKVPIAFICTVDDGKVLRVEEYLQPAEALEAAGLAE